MVSGINAALDQRLISLEPDGNYWPIIEEKSILPWRFFIFLFSVEEIPAACFLKAMNYGKLGVHVALWPNENCHKVIGASNAGFHAGEVFATGWLERKMGAWLQVNEVSDRGDGFHCREQHLERLAAINVSPNGFAPSGRFFP